MLIIIDADSPFLLADDLVRRILAEEDPSRPAQMLVVRRNEVPPCTGCLHCITRHPGRCRLSAAFEGIRESSRGCPVVVFVGPVPFGTYSPAIKNLVDRGGLVVAEHRTCRQIVVGCGEDITDEERSTFLDLTEKHRGTADVVHPKVHEQVEVVVSRSFEDNEAASRRILHP